MYCDGVSIVINIAAVCLGMRRVHRHANRCVYIRVRAFSPGVNPTSCDIWNIAYGGRDGQLASSFLQHSCKCSRTHSSYETQWTGGKVVLLQRILFLKYQHTHVLCEKMQNLNLTAGESKPFVLLSSQACHLLCELQNQAFAFECLRWYASKRRWGQHEDVCYFTTCSCCCYF